MEDTRKAGENFKKLVQILEALRGKRGCPWDREQDETSLINYFLEEAYEVVDAVTSGDAESLAEELGDVLMEVVFLARVYEEKGKFSISDILEGINHKMIRRHPHVFARKRLKSSRRVSDEWQRQKKEEKERHSVLDGLAKSFPSLLEAFEIGHRVSHYGFDWRRPSEALRKVEEEILELKKALESKRENEILLEIGDIFFSLANVSRLLGVNPEIALRQSNEKFIKRFKFMERKLREEGKELGRVSLKEMDRVWEETKSKMRR